MSPWIEELEGGCEQVDAWRHCPTSRPSEADGVEEVCGKTDPIHQMSVINNHVHHRQLSLHKTTTQAKSWRSDAPIILPGWEHHTGGSQLTPHSTPVPSKEERLWVARHSNTAPNKMSPNTDIIIFLFFFSSFSFLIYENFFLFVFTFFDLSCQLLLFVCLLLFSVLSLLSFTSLLSFCFFSFFTFFTFFLLLLFCVI